MQHRDARCKQQRSRQRVTAMLELRSYVPITKEDLRTLVDVASRSLVDFFRTREHLQHYRDLLATIVLCQGAALHYVDGKNGVKDFDVFAFFRTPIFDRKLVTPRSSKKLESGLAKFGVHPYDQARGFRTRHIDFFRKCITRRRVPAGDNAEDVLRAYLSSGLGGTPCYLAQKPVVGLWPENVFGEVLWSPAV